MSFPQRFLAHERIFLRQALKLLMVSCVRLLLTREVDGQKLIRLSRHTKQEFIIRQGERIKCKLAVGKKIIGVLSELTDSTFKIDGHLILIENVQAIAKKKKGTNLFMGVVMGVGVGLIFTGNINSRSVLYLLAAAESILLVKPIYNGTWRNVKTIWELEVIDLSKAGSSHQRNK